MTVSMRVMSAGDGYKYLLRTVAAGDGDRWSLRRVLVVRSLDDFALLHQDRQQAQR